MKRLLILSVFLLCQLLVEAQLSVSATVISNVHCFGQNNGTLMSTPSGGTPPYTYQWLPGGQTGQAATALTAGTYTIHLHDHAALTATATATVTQPATLIASVSSKTTSVCPGQSDSLFCSGTGGTIPYQYLWTAPAIDDISCPTCANTNSYPFGAPYIITAINDLNGCTASASVSITVHPFQYVTVQGPLSPVIASHSDTLIALAPGASSYLWSNAATSSSIIVSPAISTTYSVKATNSNGCFDTAHYTVDTNSIGNGNSSSTAIRIVPSTSVIWGSYSTKDSVDWFAFVPTDSNAQIIANSAYLGMPVPHVHRLTLYNSSLGMLVDEPMPDITGANQIRIDISHLHIGSTYYVRAARCPAHANMAGCNPSSAGECNSTQRWDFQMCFRTISVFVPDDSSHEAPAVSQLYYEHRGQIADLNNIPRFDIKAYTNNTKPAVFCTDSAISFVYQHVDTAKSFIDTLQRVDMVLAGSSVQPAQPVFKMEEDSNAGYLNYFTGNAPNGVPQIEGYSRMVYKNVYPNVDMHVYSNNVGTKLYFVCNPGGTGGGGNPANIELQFKGASSVSVNGSGGLDVVTELGTLTFAPGFAYTDSAGIVKAKSWQAYFVAVNSNTVKFNTGTFNSGEPLVIEVARGHKLTPNYGPQQNLDWSTYFGGADGQDVFNDMCSDDTGNVYATGYTQSQFYPVTVNAVQSRLSDGFSATLAKFSNSTNSDKRRWATYYGGDETGAYGVALDASGNIYITGYTTSTRLPMASRASSPNNYVQSSLDTTHGGDTASNAFIAMFSNDGTKTYWATYYGGGGGIETGRHIAIDGNGNMYVVGEGISPDVNSHFPLKKSSHLGSYNDSTYGTGFILEFNVSNPNAGITREWATRIGDSNHLHISPPLSGLYGCTVDASNNFYVTGFATGFYYTYPATLIHNWTIGGRDAVVSRFSATNQVLWSSYYGGDRDDDGRAIVVGPGGYIYITGQAQSDSSNGIGIQTKSLGGGFFQRSNPHNGDGYIAEFNQGGTLQWGTYFGGSGSLAGQALSMDSYNNLYVTGWDNASNMPLPTNPAGVYNQTSFVSGRTGYNAFIAVFNSPDFAPDYVWGTYFGDNLATGMCVTKSGGHNWLYIVGIDGSGYTPLVFPAGSWQEDTFYYNPIGPEGTSFISQFNIDLVIGPAGVSKLKVENGELKVYPNPTNQNVTVELNLPESEDVQVSVMNLLGETVFTATYKGEQGLFQQQLSLSALPAATYIVKAQTKDKVYYNKILKLQ